MKQNSYRIAEPVVTPFVMKKSFQHMGFDVRYICDATGLFRIEFYAYKP